jgi:glucokinase
LKRKYYIGIDIGGTKCAVVAGTEKMEIISKVQFPTDNAKGHEVVIDRLIHNVTKLIYEIGSDNLQAIGISCGGPLNSEAGIILSPPNLPGWDAIPITEIFNKKFEVPVFIQNDANACALAEFRFGAGKGTKNMVFLTFGTGLGAGLILNGKLYVGTNDMAGEVGHIRLAEDGPVGYGKRGSFEGFCSGAGIARMARKLIQEKLDNGDEVSFIKSGQKIEDLSTKDIALAASNGDKTAIEIFARSGSYLGKGLSILIDILNPQRIVIGGVYARNPALFVEFAKHIIENEALTQAADVCEIVPAELGESVGDYASLSVAMSRMDVEFEDQEINQKSWY